MFYQTLARYYDHIFPLDPTRVNFLHQELKTVGAKRVLDLACATGTYTLELARLGYNTWGTDLEPKMISLARQKAVALRLPAKFEVGDMRAPADTGISFDGVICTGNSLPHLPDAVSMGKALLGIQQVLNPGGIAIFQIVNFDPILARGSTSLPIIERGNLKFLRQYSPEGKRRLVFTSVLCVQESGEEKRFTSNVILYPVRKKELVKLLMEAGFASVNTYGNFKYADYDQLTSHAVVAIAKTG